MEAGGRGWDTVWPLTPPPSRDPPLGGNSKPGASSLKTEEFDPHIQHRSFEDPHPRDKPPKHSALRTRRAPVRENKGTRV